MTGTNSHCRLQPGVYTNRNVLTTTLPVKQETQKTLTLRDNATFLYKEVQTIEGHGRMSHIRKKRTEWDGSGEWGMESSAATVVLRFAASTGHKRSGDKMWISLIDLDGRTPEGVSDSFKGVWRYKAL